MALIGMSEAARRLGVSGTLSVRRALTNASVPLVKIHERALAVEETDLQAFIAAYGTNRGKGRPRKESQTARE